MNRQRNIKWIAIDVMVVTVGYLTHFFMTGWPHMKRGFYGGYYSARDEVPPEFSDAVDYRFDIKLLPANASPDTVLAGTERSTLVLKPRYYHYEAFSSEEVHRNTPWTIVIAVIVALLWVIMM